MCQRYTPAQDLCVGIHKLVYKNKCLRILKKKCNMIIISDLSSFSTETSLSFKAICMKLGFLF